MENNFSESNIWENLHSASFVIQEDLSSEVDGVHILAKVEGPAFFPETESRNNVFYSLDAWESAISNPEFRRRLSDRLIYGTIGHNAELSDDDIREGRFSHIVTNVFINESGEGRAEYLVLNTPPGRILNTLLRVKSKIRVSTKAAGYFKAGKKSGTKEVIPESFRLERIDFVIDPGYLDAIPELIESLQQEILVNPLNKEGTIMTEVVNILESRIQELKDEKTITAQAAVVLQESVQALVTSNANANAILENYKTLGTFAAVQESMSELSQYRALGTVHEIHEAIETGEEVIDDLSNTVQTLQDAANTESAEYEELGEPSDIKQALDKALNVVDELEQYRALGSVEEIDELISQSNAMAEALEDEQADAVAAEFGVGKEVITSLLGKGLTLEEVKDILGKVKPAVTEDDDSTKEEEVPPAEEVPPTDGDAVPPAADEVPPADEEDKDKEEEVIESRSSKLLQKYHGDKKPAAIQESKTASPSKSLVSRLMSSRK